jgi:hypothetical protein
MKISNAKETAGEKLSRDSLMLFLMGILILTNTCLSSAFPDAGIAEINEIMYNPSGNDNNLEFVEIISSTYLNLTGWTIGDLSSNDSLVLLQYKNSEYGIIVEEGYNYSGCNASVYSAGATIGNNLNNDFDSVFLYDNEKNLIATAQYNNSIAYDNEKSIEVYMNGSVKTIYESLVNGGTPCRKNSINEYFESIIADETGSDSADINITNTTDQGSADTDPTDADSVEINSTETNSTNTGSTDTNSTDTDSINNSTIEINTTDIVSTNETGNYNITNNFTTLCNITLRIETDKALYNVSEKAKFWPILNDDSAEYKIEYWIEDLFGNNVKSKYNTTNTNQKTWTTETIYPADIFLIKAKIAYLNCTDQNESDNFASAMIAVKGNKWNNENTGDNSEETSSKEPDSEISIVDIAYPADGSADFGEIVKARIGVYKGNTGKTLVSAYVESDTGKIASETTSVYFHDKYTTAELTIPIQLKPNCDKKFDYGRYMLIITGLDDQDSDEIELNGISSELCKEKIIYAAEDNQKPATVKRNSTTVSKNMTNDKTSKNIDEDLPAIKSFYTLAKKYSPEINLFAGIEYPANFLEQTQNISADNLTIAAILEGDRFKNTTQLKLRNEINYTKKTGTEKLTFKVNVSQKENLFILKLVFGNITISEKSLTVDFSDYNADSTIDTESLGDQNNAEKTETDSKITGYSVKAQSGEDEANKGTAEINTEEKTSNDEKTVYESVSEKSKMIVVYIFGIVIVISAVALIWKKAKVGD